MITCFSPTPWPRMSLGYHPSWILSSCDLDGENHPICHNQRVGKMTYTNEIPPWYFLLEQLGKMHSCSQRSKTLMDHVSLELIEVVFTTTHPRTKVRKRKQQSQEIERHWYLVISLEASVQLYLKPLVFLYIPFCLIPLWGGFLSLATKRVLIIVLKLLLFTFQLRDILMHIGQWYLDMVMLGEVTELMKKCIRQIITFYPSLPSLPQFTDFWKTPGTSQRLNVFELPVSDLKDHYIQCWISSFHRWLRCTPPTNYDPTPRAWKTLVGYHAWQPVGRWPSNLDQKGGWVEESNKAAKDSLAKVRV